MDRPAAAEGGSCVRRAGSTRSRMGKTADSGTHLLRLGQPGRQRGAQLSPAGPRLALGCVSMRLPRPASRHRGCSLHGLPACCTLQGRGRQTYNAPCNKPPPRCWRKSHIERTCTFISFGILASAAIFSGILLDNHKSLRCNHKKVIGGPLKLVEGKTSW